MIIPMPIIVAYHTQVHITLKAPIDGTPIIKHSLVVVLSSINKHVGPFELAILTVCCCMNSWKYWMEFPIIKNHKVEFIQFNVIALGATFSKNASCPFMMDK